MKKNPDSLISEALQEIINKSDASLFFVKKDERIRKSGIREIFTPYHPVNSIELFFGRQREIKRIAEYINTPGQHALIFGERGVGKSSLANMAIELLFSGIINGRLFRKRCDSEDSFESIIQEPFLEKKVDTLHCKSVDSFESYKKASLKIPIANAGLQTKTITSNEYISNPITPSYAAKVLINLSGILVIDEADILCKSVKQKLAEFVKILSDNKSNFKVLIVGIASTVGELLLYHESIQRCLKETRIFPMSPEELKLIITKGSEKFREKNNIRKIKIYFLPEVIKKIVGLSNGYPYYTQLLALKCSEEAISTQKEIIDKKVLNKALEEAALDFEQSLQCCYEKSVGYPQNDKIISLLIVASLTEDEAFDAKDILQSYKERNFSDIKQDQLNCMMNELSKRDKNIFTEISKGVYKFSDPRMPSFVKFTNWKIL